MDSKTISEVLLSGTMRLRESGIDDPRFEAEVLLSDLSGWGRAMLYAHGEEILSPEMLDAFEQGIQRRANREPMAYITGHKEFMGLDLKVTGDVLIPRPDTETVVEAAIQWLKQRRGDVSVLDLCTGSGAIGLAIKQALPQAKVTLSDLSEKALAVASDNAYRLGLSVTLVQGDFFDAVGDQRFDCIISNPPYIPDEMIEGLQPEVRDYEPRLALSGGEDGFDCYHRIVVDAAQHLKPEGLLILEAGDHQGQSLSEEMTVMGYEMIIHAYDGIGMLRGVGGFIKK